MDSSVFIVQANREGKVRLDSKKMYWVSFSLNYHGAAANVSKDNGFSFQESHFYSAFSVEFKLLKARFLRAALSYWIQYESLL